MSGRYQVVGAVAVLTQDGLTGPTKLHLHRGAVVGPGMTEAERAHHLDIGLIREIGGGPAGVTADGDLVVDPPTGADASSETPTDAEVVDIGPDDSLAGSGPDADAKREAARAKLPPNGALPDGRAGQQVWVEYAVAQGYDRAAMEAAAKTDITALFK